MKTNAENKPLPAKELHKYVWIMVGVFGLVAASFPIAMMRVSKDKKFAPYNFHLKPLTPEGQLSKASIQSATVVPIANSSPIQNNTNLTTTIAPATTPAQQSQRYRR